MNIKTNYTHTLRASYIGYITQAIINNFAPLLFLTFQTSYNIPLNKITMLVTINFSIQLLVDLLSAKFIDKIGHRNSIVTAHFFCAAGLTGMGIFPEQFSDPYTGLLASILLYSIGGGIIEVLISPLAEACPTEKKSATMSMLHSFYCWGHVLVVLASTLFFVFAGVENWKYLAFMWAIVPFLNAFYFMRVPIGRLNEGENHISVKGLLKTKTFWLFAMLMVCAGASEQAMIQWASAFAEAGLQVSKTAGDLAGPCMFAVLMGISRVFYSKFSEKINLRTFMTGCGGLCIASYLLAALSTNPLLALAGCGLCGLSVGIMWPGAFSLAAQKCPRSGTAMFAFLALAGDLGCAGGPTTVGLVSEAAGSSMKAGLLSAIVFPVFLIIVLVSIRKINDQVF